MNRVRLSKEVERVLEFFHVPKLPRDENDHVILTWRLFVWGYIVPMLLLIVALFGSVYTIQHQRAEARKAALGRQADAQFNQQRADRNLCLAINRDRGLLRKLIRGNPKQTAALLRKIGFTPDQVDAFRESTAKSTREALATFKDLTCPGAPQREP